MMNNPTDHDILIIVSTKLDQLSLDVKEVKDGTSKMLEDHSLRIAAIEKIIGEADIPKYTTLTDKNASWIHDFNVRFGFFLVLAGGAGELIAWALNVIKELPIWK